ncbi:3-hydroxyacyl-CoA dehydrogenase family protein [Proteiniborus sp. MB09-C3]|uniref:3-hydroxyacyl-CoA dehydrogenase family protein n=1 Tax=Proteiniborus sp. MB09-C3 TaxID=3050072 RepID=UPI00255258B7|nr:3-hydroxyacyl-CoA dehydrogenase family protein [Proteiniborus sp. MB09-C3]WIV10416.1 3-hydroxyacyl-CoA dehydrogenase family protein [Proteiniborus sp. MB09-C3]
MEIKTLGVVGAGAMGTGIAHVAAQNGYSVILCDLTEEVLVKSKSNISKVFEKSIARGKTTEEEKNKTLENIKTTTDLNELANADLVIEAIVEKLDIKMELFSKLESICSPKTILASNTSTMSITKLATATKRPDKFAGAHFFNPAPVMRLVEIIRGYYTSDETVKALMDFVKGLGKEGIEVKKDTPGFVVNRLMLPQFREAYLVYEEGVASIEDIDKAMTLGLNHPMGPFTLMDFTGIDIAYDSLVYLYEEFGQSHWAPPTVLKRMINAGRLGKKTNAGWYDYE